MATTITLAEGDTAHDITATLSNDAGAQDLSGATVTLKLKKQNTGAQLSAACTIADAAAGEISIPAASRADWPAGVYNAEIEVVYADLSMDVFPSDAPATLTIRSRAA